VTFSFSGKSTSSSYIYAIWIEDESGNNLQNIYICNREAKYVGPTPQPDLSGKALPNWLTKKYPTHSDIDGVTGASTQVNFSITRNLSLGNIRHFRLCFEIDRSWNSNVNFQDRPAFTYMTSLIDLDALSSPYALSVAGWMSNDTDNGDLSQQPSPAPSGYATYKYMTDTSYLQDSSGSLADMIKSAQASITVK
jgi:hypothetical protein